MAAPLTALAPVSRRKSSWLQIAALSVAGIVVASGGAILGVYSSWKSGEQIARGVSVQGQDLSGLTKIEANALLQKKFGYMSIDVQTPEHSYRVPLSALGGVPQISRSVENAYWYGRAGSLPDNVVRVLVRPAPQPLNLSIAWSKGEMRRTMAVLNRKYRTPGQDARLVFADGGLQVVGGIQGRALNVGATLQRLQQQYRPELASFKAVTIATSPRVTAADLAGTDTKLGEYQTRFDSDLRGRTRNIHVASQAIDGSVLMPGETLSFNRKTGQRTWEKGYRMAHIFETKPGAEKAEVVDGLAGGTCQVSSTLFNAVRKTNKANGRQLKIVERETHSLPVTYVPSGLDATVAWPDRDFKFRNDFAFPIYVRTAVKGNRLTIGIWGRLPNGTNLPSSTRLATQKPQDM